MSDREAASLGRLLLMEYEGGGWDPSLEKRLRTWQPAGVLVSNKTHRSPELTCNLLYRIARTSQSAPLLAHEADKSESFLPSYFPSLPWPSEVARKSEASVERFGELAGAGLDLLGFNLVLAPVLDLIEKPAESLSSRLGFGSDPSRVAACGEAFVKGLRRHRIFPCARHFPGLGSAQPDSHCRMAVSAKPMAALWREDLLPFRQVLPQLPMVMMSTGAYKAYDFDSPRPAIFSSAVVEGLLRAKTRYAGVAVADLREFEGPGSGDLAEAAVMSVQSGCDLIIVPSGDDGPERVLQEVTRRAEAGKISADRLREALRRIRHSMKSLAPPGRELRRRDFEKFVRRCGEFSNEFR